MASSGLSSVLQRVHRLWDPAQLHAWAEGYHNQPGLKAFAVRQLEIFAFTARSVRGGEVAARAAGLTYHTLLGIVPTLAVLFALIKAFGGLDRIEAPLRKLIIDNLAVGRAEEVGQWLERFINNISAGAIAGVGVIILFYSATGLLTNSEKAFNRIWGVERGRPLLMRIAVYWAMITLGPVLMGVSISASARLQSSAFAAGVMGWLPWGLGHWLIALGSALSVCLLFVLAYIMVPNTKVSFRCALIGGIVAGLLWTATKSLFISLTAGSVKYSAVYGALGALPLLMIWLYLSWIVVLFGVTYTYANQAAASGKLQESITTTSQAFRELLAARLMTEIATAFRMGDQPPTAEELSSRTGASVGTVRHVLGALSRHHLVAESSNGRGEAYLPAQDTQQLTLQQIVDVLRSREGATLPLTESPAQQRIDDAFQRANEASGTLLAQIDLRTMVDGERGESSQK